MGMVVSGVLLAATIAMFGIMLLFKDKVDKYHKSMKEEHIQKIKNHVKKENTNWWDDLLDDIRKLFWLQKGIDIFVLCAIITFCLSFAVIILDLVGYQKIVSYIEIGVIVSFVGVLASFAGIGAWALRRS